jgi:prephenate dehydratase
MKNKIIAIQGAEGSNHHKVARDFYGTSIQLKECMSFDVLVASLLDKSSNLGIMALENTIAGSIIPNYALIDNNNLHIIGEEYLNIHHHLMGLKGQKNR